MLCENIITIVKKNNNFMNYLKCSNNLKTIYFLKYIHTHTDYI